MVLSVRWGGLLRGQSLLTRMGGRGNVFFFWGGGGSSCQRNRRQQSIKGELYKIDCKLTANDGVEGGGGRVISGVITII